MSFKNKKTKKIFKINNFFSLREKHSSKRKRKGFTLVETLVSIFLFSMVMVMVSGAFAIFLRNYASAKKMQRNVESAQFAMNLMSKTLRTSEVELSVDTLNLFDYAQGRCLRYHYDSSAKKIQMDYSEETDAESLSECLFASMLGAQDITSAGVEAVSFEVLPSTTTTSGFVTMSLAVSEPNQETSDLVVQTTVSLRNRPN